MQIKLFLKSRYFTHFNRRNLKKLTVSQVSLLYDVPIKNSFLYLENVFLHHYCIINHIFTTQSNFKY